MIKNIYQLTECIYLPIKGLKSIIFSNSKPLVLYRLSETICKFSLAKVITSSAGNQCSARKCNKTHTHTHTHTFNGPLSRTTRTSRYQKGKTNLDFTEARDSEWHWHQLGYMQVCTSLPTDNHASTPPVSFLQAGCPSCRPTNSVKALKA